MSVTNQQLQAFGWRECLDLKSAGQTSQLQHLGAVIAGIATGRDGVGFTTATSLPGAKGPDRDRFDAVCEGVAQGLKGSFNGNPLPRVAALWEVDPSGKPVGTPVQIPDALAWLKDPALKPLELYMPAETSRLDSSRRFGLFVPADNGASMAAGFVSGLTGTGMRPAAATPSPNKTTAAFLLLVALVLIFWPGRSMYWTGMQLGHGIGLMQQQELGFVMDATVAPELLRPVTGSTPDDGAECVKRWTELAQPPVNTGDAATKSTPAPHPWPTTAPTRYDCLFWWSVAMQAAHRDHAPASIAVKGPLGGDKPATNSGNAPAPAAPAPAPATQAPAGAQVPAADAKTASGPVEAAEAAAKAAESAIAAKATERKKLEVQATREAQEVSLGSRVFGAFAPSGSFLSVSANARVSLSLPVALMMVGALLLVLALGLAIKGFYWGILVNGQNRLSLARCQVVAWSIITLPPIFAFASFNAGLLSVIPTDLFATDVFPEVPGAIWAALGFSFGSTMISSALLSAKDAGAPALQLLSGASKQQDSGASTFVDPPSLLSRNDNPTDAALADLFLGEDAGKDAQIDISRTQMVAITVGLISTYANAIFAQAGAVSLPALARAGTEGTALFSNLPGAGASFVALLALSHSAYLAAKATSGSPGKQDAGQANPGQR